MRQQVHDFASETIKWLGVAIAGLLVTQTFRILDQSAANSRELADIRSAQSGIIAKIDGMDRQGGRLDRIQGLIQDHINHGK